MTTIEIVLAILLTSCIIALVKMYRNAEAEAVKYRSQIQRLHEQQLEDENEHGNAKQQLIIEIANIKEELRVSKLDACSAKEERKNLEEKLQSIRGISSQVMLP
tara:strand:- start:13223 stop:13534 length:312 start_codon:yes stop_codon:yes gene_type:complete